MTKMLPTTPPINLKKEKNRFALMEPIATKITHPIQFYGSHLSQGYIPPSNEPSTVPHNAIDIIKIP
jgi:hypothetical protein